jgi:hypothetical protein
MISAAPSQQAPHPGSQAEYEQWSRDGSPIPDTQQAHLQGDPVAWVNDEMDIEFSHKPWMSAEWTPLFTHQQQANKPMTDREIIAGFEEHGDNCSYAEFAEGVRFAERFHKIGEKQ